MQTVGLRTGAGHLPPLNHKYVTILQGGKHPPSSGLLAIPCHLAPRAIPGPHLHPSHAPTPQALVTSTWKAVGRHPSLAVHRQLPQKVDASLCRSPPLHNGLSVWSTLPSRIWEGNSRGVAKLAVGDHRCTLVMPCAVCSPVPFVKPSTEISATDPLPSSQPF